MVQVANGLSRPLTQTERVIIRTYIGPKQFNSGSRLVVGDVSSVCTVLQIGCAGKGRLILQIIDGGNIIPKKKRVVDTIKTTTGGA
jgi:hypothetical protein